MYRYFVISLVAHALDDYVRRPDLKVFPVTDLERFAPWVEWFRIRMEWFVGEIIFKDFE
jgi:hypothetical protein